MPEGTLEVFEHGRAHCNLENQLRVVERREAVEAPPQIDPGDGRGGAPSGERVELVARSGSSPQRCPTAATILPGAQNQLLLFFHVLFRKLMTNIRYGQV